MCCEPNWCVYTPTGIQFPCLSSPDSASPLYLAQHAHSTCSTPPVLLDQHLPTSWLNICTSSVQHAHSICSTPPVHLAQHLPPYVAQHDHFILFNMPTTRLNTSLLSDSTPLYLAQHFLSTWLNNSTLLDSPHPLYLDHQLHST